MIDPTSAREQAEARVADTLHESLQYVSGGVPEDRDLASDVLDDLGSAGFTVLETWLLDQDVLAEVFARAAVVNAGVDRYRRPSEFEARHMARRVVRHLCPCPDCRGTGGSQAAGLCEACQGTGSPDLRAREEVPE